MPSLPQNDSPQAKKRRKQVLAEKKSRYLLNYNHIGPIQFVPVLPKGETFTIRYRLRQFLSILRVGLNQAIVIVRNFFSPPRNLEDYRSFYPILPLPEVADCYKEDAEFARQRVAGANPMVIRNVKKVNYDVAAEMRLSSEQFETVVGEGKTIAGETAEDRLYICDYTHLSTVVPGVWDGTHKTFATPLALFHLKGEQRTLVPVAIQVDPAAGSGQPVYLPGEGGDWLMAKMYVQMADGVDHELTTHLGRTHLVIQPFVMNTNRELPDSHPVYALLKPHFECTMAINQAANPDLLAPGSPIDMDFAGTLESSLETATKGIVEYYTHFFDFAFPKNLELRGVADPTLFPNCPHRDDGALHWAAIEKYVGRYVDVYYKADRDVMDDYELQNWIEAMRRGLDLASGGGGVDSLPEALEHKDQLKAILTQIVFIAGPQHASVNSPQYPLMGYIPNQPFASYQAIPTDKGVQERDLFSMLAPPKETRAQYQLLYILHFWSYLGKALGDYGRLGFGDQEAKKVLKEFQEDLKGIEKTINQRNSDGSRKPYLYMLPSKVANSINT